MSLPEQRNGGQARGRARGRARDPSVNVEMPAPGQRSSGAPPARQQETSQVPQASTSGARRRPLAQESGDLAGNMQALQLGPGTSRGSSGDQVGRGSMRGRRPLPEIPLRTRPDMLQTKKGSTGLVVKLSSNHFPLLQRTTMRLYHYHVDFAPEEEVTTVRRGLLKAHQEALGGYIFDGMSLFTIHPIQSQPLKLFSKRESDEQIIQMTVRLVADVADGDAHYIQVYNHILRQAMRYLGLQLVGRDYCDAKARILVANYPMELWPKYVNTIHQYESQLMMCCDISTKKMSTNTVYKILRDAFQQNPQRYKDNFTRTILGTIVLTTYNNATYRIDDVDFSITPKSTFLQNGKEISYMDYYKTKYSIVIHDAEQPLLMSRNSESKRRRGLAEYTCLIPELCKTTGLTEDMRNNFQLMRAVAQVECVDPASRIKKLEQFNQRIQTNEQIKSLFTKQWGMQVSHKMVEFDGRVLPEEIIIAGMCGSSNVNCTYGAGPNVDWTNSLRQSPMLSNIHLNNWVVITPSRCRRDADLFLEKIIQAGRCMGFVVAPPKIKEIAEDRIITYKNALDEVRQRYNPQLIMCVVISNSADRYAMIKKETCCTNFAVPSQVVLAKNLNRNGVLSVATKVAIQLNCKIGGAPWTVKIPLKGLMVCGFDVCHDTVSKAKSYGALVCSLDAAMTRYFSVVSEHASGEELSNFLSLNMVMAVRKFQAVNNALPERIIMYRDGVGDGQLRYVVTHEVEELKSRLREIYNGDTYKMAFIIVTKRISVRIFAGKGNPRPGTVVDDCITLPEKYDFYLVSQSCRQGTVSPTSYNIISDNVNLSADRLQILTYKMTHLYFNWNGTVRVPAPTQYAHKLAYLVGKYTHKIPSHLLEDRLFFL